MEQHNMNVAKNQNFNNFTKSKTLKLIKIHIMTN